jgi:hypothetical protein
MRRRKRVSASDLALDCHTRSSSFPRLW